MKLRFFKRSLALLLALAVVMCSLPMLVLAEGVSEAISGINITLPEITLPKLDTDAAEPSEGLRYELNEDGESYTVTDIGIFEGTDLVIPNTYKGLPVTAIGNWAFENCSSLTSIVIPDSVTNIGNYAFFECRSLTSVSIGNGVTSVGVCAFNYCSSLASVSIGNSVTSIGLYAFSGSRLTSIIIPDSVTSIGERAFYNCHKLVEVYNLSSLDIKKGSSDYGYVGCYALDIYSSLEEKSKLSTNEEGYILYDNGTKRYLIGYKGSKTDLTLPSNIGGSDYAIYRYALCGYSNLVSVVIPDGVTSISNYAFVECSSLASVSIGDSVTSIGVGAFYYCSSLASVSICNSVTSIGDMAFGSCCSLTSVSISNSVTSIGVGAFSSCSNLTSIVIPDSVTSIGYGAFYECNSLTIYCMASEKPSGWDEDWNIDPRPVYWNFKYGDANLDGVIDVLDCSLLIAFVAGGDEADLIAADFDRDGVIDVKDVSALLAYIGGKD